MLHCAVVDLLERDSSSPSDLFGSQYQAWAMWIKGVMWCQHIAFCKLGVSLWVPFISFLSTNLKVTYFFLRKSHLLHACHALIYVLYPMARHGAIQLMLLTKSLCGMAVCWRPAIVGQTCEANILAQSPVTSTPTSSSRFQALPTTTSKISIHQRTGLDSWSDLFYMRAGYSS